MKTPTYALWPTEELSCLANMFLHAYIFDFTTQESYVVRPPLWQSISKIYGGIKEQKYRHCHILSILFSKELHYS